MDIPIKVEENALINNEDIPMDAGDIPLDTEIISTETPIQTKVVCSMCDKTYANMKSLYAHKRRYHKEIQKFDCPICDKTLSNKNSLYAHQRRNHKSEIMKENQDFSEKILKLSAIQDEHTNILMKNQEITEMLFNIMQGKDMKKTYQCEICGKMLKNAGSLSTHRYNFHRRMKN